MLKVKSKSSDYTSCSMNMDVVVSSGLLVALVMIFSCMMSAADADQYLCKGSFLCSGLPQGDCNAARRKINPGTRYFTGGDKRSTGVCSGHCSGLFVSGKNCDLSGTEMITAFNELRARNCAKCGIKTYIDGCQFKADYVSGC